MPNFVQLGEVRAWYDQHGDGAPLVLLHPGHNNRVTGFLRRGRVKVRTEWRLHMMAHNFTKLYNHQIAALAA
ncbi:MAG TPA: hypothetical protein VGL78_17590 [Solirubrobacteraceae bacterium]|jgi:hypothetical protein